MRLQAVAGTCIAYLLFVVGSSRAVVQSSTADDTASLKDFQERVEKYRETHKQTHVEKKSSDSAQKLADQKREAAQKIRLSRAQAKQGDIFTPQIAAYFKKQIAAVFQGPEGNKVRASLEHAEPLPNVELKVNSHYPRNLPLQSSPPTLLERLPPLPRELQYRIVGQTLVLYDFSSDLIVDLLPEAVPVGEKAK
jgi:hypothetical protein